MNYRFGLFELDTAARILRRDGRPVALQEQPLVVLTALIEQAGEVVERSALRALLWPPDVHVDVDNGINAAVARVREALGDEAANPRFVATVPKRGYRFVAPVAVDSPVQSQEAPRPVDEAVAPPRRWWLPVILIALFAGTIVAPFWLRPATREVVAGRPEATRAEDAPMRLAVLPFAALAAPDHDAYLSVGLTDELISRLSRLQPDRLRVIARTSVMVYRDGVDDLAAFAERLRVDYVLEGTVHQEGDAVRVTAALVEAESLTRVWSATLDRRIESVLALEQEIASSVASALALELAVGEGDVQLAAGPAHPRILEGRYFLGHRTDAGFRSAIRAFEAAVLADPHAAEAHAGLAQAWALLALFDFAPRDQAQQRAAAAAAEALRLNPGSASAHWVQAALAYFYDWRVEAAAASVDHALQLAPRAEGYLLAARVWGALGKPAAAAEALQQAVTLDPLSPAVHADAAWQLFVLGHEGAALERCRRALDLNPDFLEGWDVLKWIHIVRGDEAAAIEAFLRVVRLEALHADEVDDLRRRAEQEGLPGLLRASLEDPDARLREVGQSPYNLALDHAALGETAAALGYLERAYVARETDLVALPSDPRLDGLRGDARFQRLMQQVGLLPISGLPSAPDRQ